MIGSAADPAFGNETLRLDFKPVTGHIPNRPHGNRLSRLDGAAWGRFDLGSLVTAMLSSQPFIPIFWLLEKIGKGWL